MVFIVKSEKIFSSISKLMKVSHICQHTTGENSCDVFTRYMSSGRVGCSKQEGPRCSEANLKKTGCYEEKKSKAKGKKENPFKSMWYNPECCVQVCLDVLPRFDELYYKISDKATRTYMQTWIECPERKIVPKVVCSFEKLQYPPLPKRDKKKIDTAKCPEGGDDKMLACHLGKNKNCLKVICPGCRPARDPPSCTKGRNVTDCKKVCTPYPSFSECSKPDIKPLRPVECFCLAPVPMCELFRYLKQRGQMSRLKK